MLQIPIDVFGADPVHDMKIHGFTSPTQLAFNYRFENDVTMSMAFFSATMKRGELRVNYNGVEKQRAGRRYRVEGGRASRRVQSKDPSRTFVSSWIVACLLPRQEINSSVPLSTHPVPYCSPWK